MTDVSDEAAPGFISKKQLQARIDALETHVVELRERVAKLEGGGPAPAEDLDEKPADAEPETSETATQPGT